MANAKNDIKKIQNELKSLSNFVVQIAHVIDEIHMQIVVIPRNNYYKEFKKLNDK